MKVATLEIVPELLFEFMHLPEGTRFVAAGATVDGMIQLSVEHEGLKDVDRLMGRACPTYERSPSGEVKFVGWGQ